jgi:hypothetical protein
MYIQQHKDAVSRTEEGRVESQTMVKVCVCHGGGGCAVRVLAGEKERTWQSEREEKEG